MSKHDLPIFSLPAHTKVIVSIIKNLAPGMYRIPLERCKDQRSLSQNAYMWGVVLPYVAKGMTDAWGEKIDVNQAKAAMQKQFLTRPICDQNGEVKAEYIVGTSELSTAEFATFIDQVIQFAADMLGVAVPPASQYEREHAA
jgi:hypothetical protein